MKKKKNKTVILQRDLWPNFRHIWNMIDTSDVIDPELIILNSILWWILKNIEL